MALLNFIERLKKGVQNSKSEVNQYRLNMYEWARQQNKIRDTLHVNGNHTRKFLQNAYKTQKHVKKRYRRVYRRTRRAPEIRLL